LEKQTRKQLREYCFKTIAKECSFTLRKLPVIVYFNPFTKLKSGFGGFSSTLIQNKYEKMPRKENSFTQIHSMMFLLLFKNTSHD